jgi:hypothetical protein
MAQLGANPAIAVSLELVADRPRTAPGCCILGVAHHQLSGYVTFPIPEKGLLIHISEGRTANTITGCLRESRRKRSPQLLASKYACVYRGERADRMLRDKIGGATAGRSSGPTRA